MGEVTVSSEEGVVDMEVVKAVGENRGEGKKKKKKNSTTTASNKDGSNSGIRWERFLPRMVIRVLLVEADDSTRQIISALLRKCSYKVAAVSDGLKAWEVLKGRPHNIDLILTEVDLPSISGFALLTLINEHEICKNIPVIMMSSQDSVSTVYKCMLRGAADFLVKPVRINELRNVWQHVWRRQSTSIGGSGPQPQGESATRQKVEAIAENNAAASASDHSGDSKACMRRKKGSDGDQSSCTKPDMEAESVYMKGKEDQSQPNSSEYLTYSLKLKERSNNHDSRGQNFIQQHEDVSAGEEHGKNSNKTVQQEAIRPESNGEEKDANICSDVCHRENDGLANPCKEAIDLIGTFGNHVGCSHGDSTSNHEANRQEFQHLDLSLTGFHRTAVESFEKQILNPSIGSAFSRYVSKNPQQLLHPTPVSVCGSRDHMMNNSSNNPMLDNVQSCKSIDKKVETASSRHGNANTVSTTHICRSNQQAEVPDSHTQHNVFHIPFPVGGMSLDGIRGISLDRLYSGGYSSFVLPNSVPASSSSAAKQNAVNQLDPCTEIHHLGQFNVESNPDQQNHNSHKHRTFSSISNSKQMTNNTPETMEERTRFSSVCTDQSASSSFHNNNNGGGLSHRNSFGYGSVCGSNNINSSGAGTGIRLTSESGIDDMNNVVPMDANYLRSIQREAALTKFRLKRKERCFDKKVRYESRKKLAEQRPRVKGQFVRQVPPDPPPTEYSGNLFS